MKKILTLALALTMLLSLVACGEKNEGDGAEASTTKASTTTTKAPTTTTTTASKDENATVSETVLLDEAGIKITAKSLDLDGLFGPELKLTVENDSGQDLTVQVNDTSVNGYMISSLFSVDVVDGKKATDSLTFMSSDLEACGIETIADMEFSFMISTLDEWEEVLNTDLIQLKTSAADTYVYEYDDSGETLYNEGGIKIVSKGFSDGEDSLFGPCLLLYVENSTDKELLIQTENVSVNECMADALFLCTIGAGKHAVDDVTFMSDDFEENEIAEIETVEMTFIISDSDTWETIAKTDPVTAHF